MDLASHVAEHRFRIYVGGLLLVVAARLVVQPRPIQTTLVAVALGVMVVTYAVERWDACGRQVASPGLLAIGAVGVTLGFVLTAGASYAGFAFLGGGLLFVHRAFGEKA